MTIPSKKTRRPIAFTPNLMFWLWVIATMLLVLIFAIIGTAWIVRLAIKEDPRLSANQLHVITAISEFPVILRTSITQLRDSFNGDPTPLLLDRKATENSHWLRKFPQPADSGYLLFSGVASDAKSSVVRLIRIADGAVIARWEPNWNEILVNVTSKKHDPAVTPDTARAFHPLLLANGDIIFNTATALVRMSPCSSKPEWILDETMHHSIELDASGALWVPSISEDGLPDNVWLRDKIRDDAIAQISTNGKILKKISFIKILRDNGLEAMLFGHSGGTKFNNDPIHINQIQIAKAGSKYWQAGDLLISARHLSAVFLYRPSTNKIIWHKVGPWLNQHSVEFVNDHQISVFDNNVIASVPGEYAFMSPSGNNRVLLLDFDTNIVSEPFADLLAKAHPITITEGRARILDDGGLYVEESNYGRHLRFTKDNLMWSRVNDYDETRIGLVSWSRYLTAEEAHAPINALQKRLCIEK